jgi:hypothetical protein
MDDERTDQPVLGKDIPWEQVREKLCLVIDFRPMAKVENGKVAMWNSTLPYGFLTVECEGLAGQADVWLTHRLDFLHVWEAFEQRNEAQGKEVIVIPLRRKRLLAGIFPVFQVWLCHHGTFNKLLHPELQKPGEAGALEIVPIARWGVDT